MDKILFQKVTCINDNNISCLKKDTEYYAVEYEYTYKIYETNSLKTKKGQSALIGEYSKSRFFNLAKWRDEQIDSILNDDNI